MAKIERYLTDNNEGNNPVDGLRIKVGDKTTRGLMIS